MYLSTDPTGVRLDPSMQAHVSCKHVAACKTPFTDITVVGFTRLTAATGLGAGLTAATGLVSRGHVLG